jgi:uncharacterized membrane protein YfcA
MARPNLSYLKNLILTVVGIPCGFLTGVSGIGSSSLVGTLVRYLLGLRDSRANGAALLTTVAATLGCLIAYTQHHAAPWLLAIIVTVGQIFGAAFGQRYKSQSSSVVFLRPVLAVLVTGLGIVMMVTRAHYTPLLKITGLELYPCGLVVGVVIGLISGILDIGGVLTVPAALYLLGLPVLVCQGLSILILLVASSLPAVVYFTSSAIEARSASWLPFGAIFGALMGAYYATSRFSPSFLIDFDGLAIALFGLYHLFNRPKAPQLADAEDLPSSE